MCIVQAAKLYGEVHHMDPHRQEGDPCKCPWAIIQINFFIPLTLSCFKCTLELIFHGTPGMELYASALWHLQKDIQLSVVAEMLHSSNKTSPQALCAMASVMNRYKDHTAAVKYLQRALQVCVCVSVCVCESVCV